MEAVALDGFEAEEHFGRLVARAKADVIEQHGCGRWGRSEHTRA
ncbi:hypothetical protein F4561_005138 [Lipingzhangella halophila]|uniref:Uncharacterized protein n=1 Tax=Lipingzhangella halophila TaxID=1783352 RepID=A0A7W7W546_9ACTN|nr:hypothetical protein [Lipingzhangella halophila]MBB4934318.1 hypothetical protein [Lipingzhangella halophila]